ncbi:TRAP transporter small permease [uncultured Desulfuromonas sp.]|uniref:TRAP transporter small permease n=1 Tax=uncultured Desulfuromonas sp. TaxID=181013 RepID=UPI002AAB36E9|nr:TRAP transporter small permease [uncultured Desulfuromonas sp.]
MKRVVHALSRMLRGIEDTLLAVLLAVMVILAVGQIVQRNLFDSGFVWTDELLRILVLWLTVIGALVASRTDQHIRMDVLVRFVPSALQGPLRRVVFVATAVVCGVLAWHSYQFVHIEAEYGSVLLGGYPSWWFQCVIPIGFALICWRYLGLAIYPPPAQQETSEAV